MVSPWDTHNFKEESKFFPIFIMLVIAAVGIMSHEATHYAIYHGWNCKDIGFGFSYLGPTTHGDCSALSTDDQIAINTLQSQVEIVQYPLLLIMLLLVMLFFKKNYVLVYR